MSHPQSCTDPDCDLRYVEHLRGLQISPAAMPTRAVTRTPGKPDEAFTVTQARQDRFDRENDAFKTLCDGGKEPPTLESAPARLRELGG